MAALTGRDANLNSQMDSPVAECCNKLASQTVRQTSAKISM